MFTMTLLGASEHAARTIEKERRQRLQQSQSQVSSGVRQAESEKVKPSSEHYEHDAPKSLRIR